MALVLAIEPDLRQAAILKRIVKEQVKADLVVVDSRDAAMEAIARGVPDVLLLSALMSPRDEDELIQHLRSLEDADHLQTHTIPQLASTLADREESKGGGLFGMFRRKKEPEAVAGCDPDLFADEIRTFVKYAAENKEERRALAESGRLAAAARQPMAEPIKEAVAADTASSSWDDPFQWKPTNPSSLIPNPESPIANPESGYPESGYPESAVAHLESANPESAHFETEAVPVEAAEAGVEEGPAGPEPVAEPRVEMDVQEPEPAIAQAAIAVDAAPAMVEHDPWATDYRPKEAIRLVAPEPPRSEPVEPIVIRPFEPPVEPPIEPLAVRSFEHIAEEPEPEQVVALGPDLIAAEPEPVPALVETEDAADAEPLEVEEVAAAAPQAPRSLGPLATWVRFETKSKKDAERTTSDELRELMAHLAIPPHVAGVSYARGCRIRRVRVPGGRERRKGAVPGPVILSRRQLDRARETSA